MFRFETFVFRLYFLSSVSHRRSVVLFNYPPEWYERYREQKYHAVDPAVKHCRVRTTPLIWSKIAPVSGAGLYEAFLSDARSIGLRHGITFSVHGGAREWGFFNLCRSWELIEAAPELLAAGQLFSTYLQEAVRRIVLDRDAILEPHDLSRREKECLAWAAEGKTAWETSKILGIAERTVTFHVQKAMDKLNASNRTQAATRIAVELLTDPEVISQGAAFNGTLVPCSELAISVGGLISSKSGYTTKAGKEGPLRV